MHESRILSVNVARYAYVSEPTHSKKTSKIYTEASRSKYWEQHCPVDHPTVIITC